METIAAGFADPDWVPQKITVVAWGWIGEEEVHAVTRLEGVEKMLRALRDQIAQASMLTGHNIARFDLPILQSELLRHGLPPLEPILVQDTMRLVKTKGFKKGQDNLSQLLRVEEEKLPLTWQQWQDAYDEKEWETVVERCVSDVVQHKQLRQGMIERGWLKPPRMWRP